MTDKMKAYPAASGGGADLRDVFAGQIAAASIVSATGLGSISKENRAILFKGAAEISYELADALMEARNN